MEHRKVLYTEWRRSLINGVYRFGSQHKWSRTILNSAPIYQHLLKWFDSWNYPMTARDYSNWLFDKFSIRISDHVVRRILKEMLLLSYKKGKSRPVGIDLSKQQAMKRLFAVKVISYLSKFEMLISVDESSFSRATKLSNLWLMKGFDQELQNIWFDGSTSLITSITSTGIVFGINTSGSVDGSIFAEYLRRLKQMLKDDLDVSIENCLLFMDNATTHRSEVAMKFMNENHCSAAFIPPYMPDLNPIEKYFSKLKNMILRETVGARMKWQSKEASTLLKKCIFRIDTDQVRKLWLSFTQELTEAVHNLSEII